MFEFWAILVLFFLFIPEGFFHLSGLLLAFNCQLLSKCSQLSSAYEEGWRGKQPFQTERKKQSEAVPDLHSSHFTTG